MMSAMCTPPYLSRAKRAEQKLFDRMGEHQPARAPCPVARSASSCSSTSRRPHPFARANMHMCRCSKRSKISQRGAMPLRACNLKKVTRISLKDPLVCLESALMDVRDVKRYKAPIQYKHKNGQMYNLMDYVLSLYLHVRLYMHDPYKIRDFTISF